MVVFGATPKLTLKAKTTVTDEMMAIQCFSSWLMQLVRGGTCAGRLSGKALARTCWLELFSRLIRDFDQSAPSTPLCTLCRAPLLCVHAPNCTITCARAYLFTLFNHGLIRAPCIPSGRNGHCTLVTFSAYQNNKTFV